MSGLKILMDNKYYKVQYGPRNAAIIIKDKKTIPLSKLNAQVKNNNPTIFKGSKIIHPLLLQARAPALVHTPNPELYILELKTLRQELVAKTQLYIDQIQDIDKRIAQLESGIL